MLDSIQKAASIIKIKLEYRAKAKPSCSNQHVIANLTEGNHYIILMQPADIRFQNHSPYKPGSKVARCIRNSTNSMHHSKVPSN